MIRSARMSPPRPRLAARGFTLIEVMIVVAVVGVLAMLAVVGYRKWVRSAHIAEATNLVGNIRQAQERRKAETGSYLDVSQGLAVSNLYPVGAGDGSAWQWGAPCGAKCKAEWRDLGVSAAQPVTFGYATVADGPACDPGCKKATIKVAGQAVDTSALSGQSWYIVEAIGSPEKGGGTPTAYDAVYGNSADNNLIVAEEEPASSFQ